MKRKKTLALAITVGLLLSNNVYAAVYDKDTIVDSEIENEDVLTIKDGVTLTATASFFNTDSGIVEADNANIVISTSGNIFSNSGKATIGSLMVSPNQDAPGSQNINNSGELTINKYLKGVLQNSGKFIYNGRDAIDGSIISKGQGEIFITNGELKITDNFKLLGSESIVAKNETQKLTSLEVGKTLTVGDSGSKQFAELLVEDSIKADRVNNYGTIKANKLIVTSGFNVYYRKYNQEACIETNELIVEDGKLSNIGIPYPRISSYGKGKVIVHNKVTLPEGHTIKNYGKLLFDGDTAIVTGNGTIENLGIEWKEVGERYSQNTFGIIAKKEAGEKIKELTVEGTLNNTGIIAVETLNVANGYDDTFENSDKSSTETFNVDNLNILDGGSFALNNDEYELQNVGVGANAELAAAGAVNNVQSVTLADSATFETKSLSMTDGGAVTSDGGSLTTPTMSGESLTFNLQSDKAEQINVTEFSGSDLTINVASLTPAQVVIGEMTGSGVTINGNSDITDSFESDNIEAGLQSLAYTASINEQNGADQSRKVASAAGKILGPTEAMTDAQNNIIKSSVKEGVNPANEGISEMASIALMTWRQENNDMNKRLGELRDSTGEHGVWVRMTRGEAKYGNQNIKNQYNAYQLGYDEKLSVDKRWTVGAALTYTDAESSFGYGKGENKHKGLAIYGSRLNDDGSFIDLIARYARLEHDYEVHGGAGKGDFDTNGYSLSAEYGKRFTQDNGLWIEPQVELTYGRVSSGSYLTNNGVRVQQDGMDSLVGRLGFALGKNLAKGKGNVYLRASYLYDFDGETDVRYSYNQQNKRFEQDLGGGWWEFGVGTNINLCDASHLYFDVEKTYGGDVATPWQWNAGVRWSF